MQTEMQNVIDKQAIQDLQVFYSMSIDSGSYDNLDDVFTREVVSDYGHAGTHQGIPGIKEACRIALDPLPDGWGVHRYTHANRKRLAYQSALNAGFVVRWQPRCAIQSLTAGSE